MCSSARLALRGFVRTYASRPKIGTKVASRPPYRAPDPLESVPESQIISLVDNKDLTFFHRPPPTAPTPFSLTTAPASPLLRSPTPVEPDTPLPPFLHPSNYKPTQPDISEEAVEEIRKLRRTEPHKYSRGKLARMFGCSSVFVARVAALPKPTRNRLRKEQDMKVEKVKSGWGETKRMVRAIREKRREFW